MIYAVSDIHGQFDRYEKLLEQTGFGPEDTLYVLGDVIDRGPDGFRMMLDMIRRPNVINLLGNHEDMAMKALPGILQGPGREGADAQSDRRAKEHWYRNGGDLSLADFLRLDSGEKKLVWEYMQAMPLYQELEAGGRRFVLVHGGLEDFSPRRPLADYSRRGLLWCRPGPDTVYYTDRYVVFGHTPVQYLFSDRAPEDVPANIYHGSHIIDIDCGCAYPNGRLGCLCLDTLEEFYV